MNTVQAKGEERRKTKALCLSDNQLDVIRWKEANTIVDFTGPPVLVRCVGHFDKVTAIES